MCDMSCRNIWRRDARLTVPEEKDEVRSRAQWKLTSGVRKMNCWCLCFWVVAVIIFMAMERLTLSINTSNSSRHLVSEWEMVEDGGKGVG